MKNTFLALGIAAALTGGVISAKADLFTDFDPLNLVASSGSPVAGTFDITTDADGDGLGNFGFSSAGWTIVSASAWFQIAGSDGGSLLSIDLGGSSFSSGSLQDGFPFFSSFVHGGSLGSLLFEVQDGVVDYQINLELGNPITVLSAELRATAQANSQGSVPVPDAGTTLALLGLGLSGLGVFSRRSKGCRV